MVSSRTALLTGPGAGNAGSGLFLPVALLYVTRGVGLPLAVAGTVVALGTVAGLGGLAAHAEAAAARRVVVVPNLSATQSASATSLQAVHQSAHRSSPLVILAKSPVVTPFGGEPR
jgi:hypothetical protein